MTREDILKLKNFTQSIIDNPRPLDEQWCERKDEHIWCSDWEIIEVCKYLFNGHNDYMGDPPPNRLKNNPLWSKNKIAAQGNFLLNHYGNVDDIINKLKEERNRGAISDS